MSRFAPLAPVAALALTLAAPGGAAAQTRLAFGVGATNIDGATLTLRAITPSRNHGFDWSVGLYAVETGSAWVGAGVSYTLRPTNGGLFLRGSFMPGFYYRGNGRDLGGPLEFATVLEIGTDLRNGAQLSLAFEHRSNASLYAINPGADTVSIVYTLPLR